MDRICRRHGAGPSLPGPPRPQSEINNLTWWCNTSLSLCAILLVVFDLFYLLFPLLFLSLSQGILFSSRRQLTDHCSRSISEIAHKKQIRILNVTKRSIIFFSPSPILLYYFIDGEIAIISPSLAIIMAASTSIEQPPTTRTLREGSSSSGADASSHSTPSSTKSKQKRDYKGFVAGVFSGIAKLSGGFFFFSSSIYTGWER